MNDSQLDTVDQMLAQIEANGDLNSEQDADLAQVATLLSKLEDNELAQMATLIEHDDPEAEFAQIEAEEMQLAQMNDEDYDYLF